MPSNLRSESVGRHASLKRLEFTRRNNPMEEVFQLTDRTVAAKH